MNLGIANIKVQIDPKNSLEGPPSVKKVTINLDAVEQYLTSSDGNNEDMRLPFKDNSKDILMSMSDFEVFNTKGVVDAVLKSKNNEPDVSINLRLISGLT